MSGSPSRSGGKLLRAVQVSLAGAILTAGTVCHAADQPAPQSCLDDSKAAAAVGASKTAGTQTAAEANATKPHSVKLTWNASVPASAAPQNAIKGYNIYRHEPLKEYEQINRVLIHETGCIDYAVSAGHKYFYQAEAVSVGGKVSKRSNQAVAIVAAR